MPKPPFHIHASRAGLRLTVDEEFWNDNALRPDDRATALDYNIAFVIEEIRAALYTVARYSSYDSKAYKNN